MKVVLLKDVPSLGKRFDIKNVSDGHALNFLIPQGLVRVATPGVVKTVEAEKAKDHERRKKEEAVIVEKLAAIDGAVIEVSAKANEKGHLFAGLNKTDIVPHIAKRMDGFALTPEYLELGKPIKEAGEHVLNVRVGDKKAKVTLIVKAA